MTEKVEDKNEIRELSIQTTFGEAEDHPACKEEKTDLLNSYFMDIFSSSGYSRLKKGKRASTEPNLSAKPHFYNHHLQTGFYYPSILSQHDQTSLYSSDDCDRIDERGGRGRLCVSCGVDLKPKGYLEKLEQEMETIDNLSKFNPLRMRARLEEKTGEFKLHHQYRIRTAIIILVIFSLLLLSVVLIHTLFNGVPCENKSHLQCPPVDSPYHVHDSGLNTPLCCGIEETCCMDSNGVSACCASTHTCCGGNCCPQNEQCCGDVCVPKEYSCCRSGVYCGNLFSCCVIVNQIMSCCPTATNESKTLN